MFYIYSHYIWHIAPFVAVSFTPAPPDGCCIAVLFVVL